MVKQNPKEKLNNKAAKMIDLALDEVFEGGSKAITASFKDKKFDDKIYTLTVQVDVTFETEEEQPSDSDTCQCHDATDPSTDNPSVEPSTDTPTPIIDDDSVDDDL